MTERWILHVDMDAFFAAVEVLDNPRLAGKPVIVGGTPQGHGVVSTANYEARKFGVHSAMPAAQAVRLCPQGIFLRPRLSRYSGVSRQVFNIFRDLSPVVEPLSIDEAFLDVTGCHPSRSVRVADDGRQEARSHTAAQLAIAVAREIQARVESETGGLSCSIGVAENKFLAKVASDLQKPRGLVTVPRGKAREFLAKFAIERLWGVGPRTSERLRQRGLRRIGDLSSTSQEELARMLGEELGRHLHRLSHGIDARRVNPRPESKSIGHETTFAEFIPNEDTDTIFNVLFSLSHQVAFRLLRERLWARTVTLKVRDETFRTMTRSQTLPKATQLVEQIFLVARSLFETKVSLGSHRVRLLGVSTTQLDAEPVEQLELFDQEAVSREKSTRLADVEARVRKRLGDSAITRGRLVEKRRKDE